MVSRALRCEDLSFALKTRRPQDPQTFLPMSTKVRGYKSETVTVWYNVTRCIHAKECVHGLPQVFDPDRRPWIDPEQAQAGAIAEVIMRCPTGALHATRHDADWTEPTPSANTITVAPDGPLYVRGDLVVEGPDGAIELRDTRIALCRCGASQHKPFCDGSHVEAGFEDDGMLDEVQVKPAKDGADGRLHVQPTVNGPLLLQGPFTMSAPESEPVTGGQAAFCRCGASGNKPFCDGSHRDAGFTSAGGLEGA